MRKESENWLKIARYDLKTAKLCFREGLYLKVYENAHAALEKLLKGIIEENINKRPPRIHNLLKLASVAVIEQLDKEIKSTLDELNNAYLSVRYPGDFEEISSYLDKNNAEDIMKKAERIFKWLEMKIN